MAVSKRKNWRTWRWDFTFQGKRYTGNTHQFTREAAKLAEREFQIRLRHKVAQIGQFYPQDTPTFSAWAQTFLAYKAARLDRVDHVKWVTGVVLRFFGTAPPGAEKTAKTPYHNLRLGDVVADPEWIVKFEAWMRRRKIGGQSRNHYRSIMRRMYRLAMQPAYQKTTGVTTNPFIGLENDPTMERTVVLTPTQLRSLISHASYHVRLALSIAALCPKLRLANILAMEWAHIEPDPRLTKFTRRVAYYVTVHRHKTMRRTRRPQVAPLPKQLVTILKDAYRRAPESPYVLSYRGQPLKTIRDGVRLAAEAAGLTYGRDVAGGLTLHSLRHTAATMMSRHEVDPLKVRDALGHGDLSTTLKYRHLQPVEERPTLERLSKRFPISDLVMAPGDLQSRAGGTRVVTRVQTGHELTRVKTPAKVRRAKSG